MRRPSGRGRRARAGADPGGRETSSTIPIIASGGFGDAARARGRARARRRRGQHGHALHVHGRVAGARRRQAPDRRQRRARHRARSSARSATPPASPTTPISEQVVEIERARAAPSRTSQDLASGARGRGGPSRRRATPTTASGAPARRRVSSTTSPPAPSSSTDGRRGLGAARLDAPRAGVSPRPIVDRSAPPPGFEPGTRRLEGCRSIQLSYGGVRPHCYVARPANRHRRGVSERTILGRTSAWRLVRMVPLVHEVGPPRRTSALSAAVLACALAAAAVPSAVGTPAPVARGTTASQQTPPEVSRWRTARGVSTRAPAIRRGRRTSGRGARRSSCSRRSRWRPRPSGTGSGSRRTRSPRRCATTSRTRRRAIPRRSCR